MKRRLDSVRISGLLALLGGLWLWAGPVHAQEQQIVEGSVVDLQERPVPGQPVLLHRVTGAGGAMVASGETDEQGRFRLSVSTPSQDDGVYFVATRYSDRLYIGELFRSPFTGNTSYVVKVGGEGASVPGLEQVMRQATSPVVRPPESPRRWALLIIPLLALIGVVAALIRTSGRPAQGRRTLIRLAELEEMRATNTGPTELLDRERTALRNQLLSGAIP